MSRPILSYNVALVSCVVLDWEISFLIFLEYIRPYSEIISLAFVCFSVPFIEVSKLYRQHQIQLQ